MRYRDAKVNGGIKSKRGDVFRDMNHLIESRIVMGKVGWLVIGLRTV